MFANRGKNLFPEVDCSFKAFDSDQSEIIKYECIKVKNFKRCYSRSRVSYAKGRSGDDYFHSSIGRSDKDFESIVGT